MPHPQVNPDYDPYAFDQPSDAVQEMLGKMPNWLIRWGITIILLVVVGALVGAWFISYPEVIPARLVLSSDAPPVPVIARSAGQVGLWVKSGTPVAKNTSLGIIQNAANTEDVLNLQRQLPVLEEIVHALDINRLVALDDNPELGSIQPYYSTFLQRLHDYRFFMQTNLFSQRIRALQQLQNQPRLGRNELVQQRDLAKRELAYAQRRYQSQKQLFDTGAIPRFTLEDAEATVTQARRALESYNGQISSFDLQQQLQSKTYTQQILDLQQQYEQQRQQYQSGLRDAFRLLKNSVEEWGLNFLLKAPVSGDVALFRFQYSEQFVRAGEEVLTIIPPFSENSRIIGRAFLPHYNTGRIKKGQKVRIQVDAYPPHEYGFLEGTVENISTVSRQLAEQQPETYQLEVALPSDLRTTYKKQIIFKPELTGNAEIITENLNLIERLLYQFRKMWLERTQAPAQANQNQNGNTPKP